MEDKSEILYHEFSVDNVSISGGPLWKVIITNEQIKEVFENAQILNIFVKSWNDSNGVFSLCMASQGIYMVGNIGLTVSGPIIVSVIAKK